MTEPAQSGALLTWLNTFARDRRHRAPHEMQVRLAREFAGQRSLVAKRLYGPQRQMARLLHRQEAWQRKMSHPVVGSARTWRGYGSPHRLFYLGIRFLTTRPPDPYLRAPQD